MKTILSGRLSVFDTKMHRTQRSAINFLKGTIGRRLAEPFRTYGAFSIVMSSALLVSLANVAQEKNSGSAFLGYFKDTAMASEMPRKKIAAQTEAKENLSLVPLASAPTMVDPTEKLPETTEIASDGMLLSAWDQASISKDPEEDGGVQIYTVAQGDTLSSIAGKYGITVNTILWANDLPNADAIKPGDQIFILPVSGLSHIVVAGETLDDIAKKFNADKAQIIAFNSLLANGEIKVGDTIVIPGGSKVVPPSPSTIRRQYASPSGPGTATDISGGGYRKLEGKAGTGHKFPYGYCTWYVAQKRYVPWSGNAGTWLYNARSMGYKTGRTPAVGAIMVTTENRYYGHVAVVEKILGGSIIVSEMNYRAWGKVDRREISLSSRAIKGFVY
jgi:surface antigen/LysM repeat protein